MCFSLNDLCVILDNKELKDILFVSEETLAFKKTFEKLVNKSSTLEIERIKKNIENERIILTDNKKKKEIEVRGYPLLQFFLISELLTSKKYKKIFSINQEKPSFTLQELPSTESEEDNRKNNIIKVKNFICILLNNYRTLVKTDFTEGITNNTTMTLKQLKKYIRISNFVIDGNVLSDWYVDSLIEYLKKFQPIILLMITIFYINKFNLI